MRSRQVSEPTCTRVLVAVLVVVALSGATDPVSACPNAPDPGCDVPEKSILSIKDKNEDGAGDNDGVTWKWIKGPSATQADFGDPVTTAAYDWCLYAGTTSALVMSAHIDAGGVCDGAPCWKPIGDKGYKFADPTTAQDGAFRFTLKGDPASPNSKIFLKGRDGNLDLSASTLPISEAGIISVRVHNSENANCWGADFGPNAGHVLKNNEAQFKAKRL